MKYLYLTFTLFTSIVFAQDCDKGLFNEFNKIDRSKPMISYNDVNYNNDVIIDESGKRIFLYNHQNKANYFDRSSGYNQRFNNGYIIKNPNEKLLFESKSIWIKNDLSIGTENFIDFYLPDYKCGDMKILLKDFFDLLTSLEGNFKCIAEMDEVTDNLVTRKITMWENGLIWEQSYDYDNYKDSGLLKRKVTQQSYYHTENQTPLLKVWFDPRKDLIKPKMSQFLRFSDVVTIFNSKGCVAVQLSGLNGETYLRVSNPNETEKIFNDPSFRSKLNTYRADEMGLPLRYEVVPSTTEYIKVFDEENLMYNMIEEFENIDTYNLIEFYNIFMKLLNSKKIYLKNKTNNVEIIFEVLSAGTLAEAHAMDDDNLVLIKVDPNEWKKSSIQKKSYVMFHELFHDVFNLRHGQGGKMMFCFAEKDYDWYNFIYDTNKLLSFLKSNHGITRLNNYYYK